MNQVIEIEFKPDGTIVAEGKNITGKACDALMKPFEDALGTTHDRKDKAEYYQQPVTTGVQQKIG